MSVNDYTRSEAHNSLLPPSFQTQEVLGDIYPRHQAPDRVRDHERHCPEMVSVYKQSERREAVKKVIPDTLARELTPLIRNKGGE